jgi:hypothetical protein
MVIGSDLVDRGEILFVQDFGCRIGSLPRSATVMDCRLDCGWASHWLLSVWLSFGSDLLF